MKKILILLTIVSVLSCKRDYKCCDSISHKEVGMVEASSNIEADDICKSVNIKNYRCSDGIK